MNPEDSFSPPGTPGRGRRSVRSAALAAGVHVRSVDEVDACVERAADQVVDPLLIERAHHLPDLTATAERHRAEAQLADEHTGISKFSIVHRSSLSGSQSLALLVARRIATALRRRPRLAALL